MEPQVAPQQVKAHETNGRESPLEVRKRIAEGNDEEVEPHEKPLQALGPLLLHKGVERGREEIEQQVRCDEPVLPRSPQQLEPVAWRSALRRPHGQVHGLAHKQREEAEAQEVAPAEVYAKPARDEHKNVHAADTQLLRQHHACPHHRFRLHLVRARVAQGLEVRVEHHHHHHGEDAEQFNVRLARFFHTVV